MRRLPPIAAVIDFIHFINHGDVDGLGNLMTEDHTLRVFDEEQLVGRDANIDAWLGYVSGFPDYVIYPERLAERGATVAVLGHTTGSHLRLAEVEERRMSLIWLAEVSDGKLRSWTLVEDSTAHRHTYGLD